MNEHPWHINLDCDEITKHSGYVPRFIAMLDWSPQPIYSVISLFIIQDLFMIICLIN